MLGLSYGTWDLSLGCAVFSLVAARGSRKHGTLVGTRGLSGWGALAQWLQCMGIVTLKHVGSCYLCSATRDRIQVPCIGRWIPNCWTTSEVPLLELPNRTMTWRRSITGTAGRFHFLTCYVVCRSWLTVCASVQARQWASPLLYWVSILIC